MSQFYWSLTPPKPHFFCHETPLQSSIIPPFAINSKRIKYFRDLILNLIFINALKYFDVSKNILKIIGINSTEFREVIMGGFISLIFIWLIKKMLELIVWIKIRREAHKLIKLYIRYPNWGWLISTIYALKEESQIDFAAIFLAKREWSDKEKEYCYKLGKSIDYILQKKYDWPWNLSSEMSRCLANYHVIKKYYPKKLE